MNTDGRPQQHDNKSRVERVQHAQPRTSPLAIVHILKTPTKHVDVLLVNAAVRKIFPEIRQLVERVAGFKGYQERRISFLLERSPLLSSGGHTDHFLGNTFLVGALPGSHCSLVANFGRRRLRGVLSGQQPLVETWCTLVIEASGRGILHIMTSSLTCDDTFNPSPVAARRILTLILATTKSRCERRAKLPGSPPSPRAVPPHPPPTWLAVIILVGFVLALTRYV